MAKAMTKAQKAMRLTAPMESVIGSPSSVSGPLRLAQRSVIVTRSNVPEATPMSWIASSRPNEPAMV